MKILYVDFCGTLTTRSTLYKFSKFVYLRHSLFTKIYFMIFFFFARYLNLLNINLFKAFNNMSVIQLDEYAKSFFKAEIENNINKKIINYIKKAIKNDYYIVIISGGLSNYIKHINKFVKIDKIIAKEFVIEKDRIKSKFKKGSVFQIDKVFQIFKFEKHFNEKITERIVISDSEDDIPLFLLANKKIVVNPSSDELIELAKHMNWKFL